MALLRDLRYGIRMIMQSPVATIVAVLALALGIGLNISSFIAVDAMVLHPFPFPRLSRIMTVWEARAKSPDERDFIAPANFIDLEKQSRSFDDLAAYRSWAVLLTGTNVVTGVRAAFVSPSFFQILGVGPRLGRTFTANEGQSGGSRSIVVSEAFWHKYLAGAPDAVGRHISLNRQTCTVVGVMPDQFDFPLGNEIWAPLAITVQDEGRRSDRSLQVLGLLKADVSPQQAESEVQQIAQRLEGQYPVTNLGRTMRILPILTVTNEITDKFVLLLLGAASMVLLLACANVTNLQLARAARREKEIAVRAALGASRFQIARQLAAESILIAGIGGVFALFLAGWNLDVTKARIPAIAFRYAAGLRNMQIDAIVVAYTFAVAIFAGLLASLPAITRLLRQRSLTDLNEALQTGGRTSDSSSSSGRNRVQRALIVLEVAVALILLVGATLMVKSFNGLLTGSYGFETKNILRLDVSLPETKYAGLAPIVAFYDRTLRKLQTLPGAQAAALWSQGPDEQLRIEGRPEETSDELHPEVEPVSSQYLQSMHIPLLQGRFLSEHDRPDTPRVAVLSAAVAHAFWRDRNPIGQRIKLGTLDSNWVTVVGVAGDIVRDRLSNRPAHLIYVPYTQTPLLYTTFVIRTTGDPQQLARATQDKVRELDPDLPIYSIKSMDRYLYEQMSGVQAAADTMTRYAAVALMLAATGIFGVISYFVAQRTRDIGVHRALGASTKDVLEMTARQTMQPSLLGVLIGIGGAYFLSNLLSRVLFNFVKLDWPTFLLCTLILMATVFLASYIPARRATRIDPLIALRDG
jgi:putative ABC transport system permease protein